ncbi:MAG: hypothetical protein HZC01_00555 [Candidatus Kerfeldbacteria bacterium]|nr:hypothetical protein [Candidatus Kerfeldbacteria bacterium]
MLFSLIPTAFAQEAATTANASAQFMQNVDWTRPTWDLFIILFFIVAAFLYGLSLGRDRIIVILISLYVSLALVDHAPFLNSPALQDWLNNFLGQFFVVQISAFLFIFIFLFVVITRSALMRSIGSADTAGPWWQVLLFSVMHVGLLVSIILSYLPAETTNTVLAPLTKQVFSTDPAQSFWIIAPIVALFVLKGTGARKRKVREEADET